MQIVMMGATGAVGNQVVRSLLESVPVKKLTLLGRRSIEDLPLQIVHQHAVDIFSPPSYSKFMIDHQISICTLGVGQPSKVGREAFLKIDKQAVLDFAHASKKAGVEHFELLSSVGINAKSRSFYLRSKGELVEEIQALKFERFSVFQPSMILTPTNRYGLMQGITLKVWPLLHPILLGGLSKYRGIRVELLGQAMALNILRQRSGLERLEWADFHTINGIDIATKDNA